MSRWEPPGPELAAFCPTMRPAGQVTAVLGGRSRGTHVNGCKYLPLPQPPPFQTQRPVVFLMAGTNGSAQTHHSPVRRGRCETMLYLVWLYSARGFKYLSVRLLLVKTSLINKPSIKWPPAGDIYKKTVGRRLLYLSVSVIKNKSRRSRIQEPTHIKSNDLLFS